MDAESREWLRLLDAGACPADRRTAIERLHERLLRVARREVHRRHTAITGSELDDIAQQAASDATLSILGKLDSFRGESRFTTWAYKFVILEVAHKIGRHHWCHPPVALDTEDWKPAARALRHRSERARRGRRVVRGDQARCRGNPDRAAAADVRAIVIQGTPLDALVVKLGVSRNAIYKTIFDARRKIREFLVTNEYLTNHVALERP